MAGSGDDPMHDASRPRRRFMPQLVEETTRSSAAREQQPTASNNDINDNNHDEAITQTTPTSNETPKSTAQDAPVQVDDVEMSDAPPPTKPIRRYVPVPIETTYNSHRVNHKNPHGPAAEPTPDPSPTISRPSSMYESQSTPTSSQHISTDQSSRAPSEKKPKRRFAPQLIETTRRARRSGQEGPATKPTDKTDITPGTNHIYVPKSKRKHGPRSSAPRLANASGDSDEENPSRFLTPRRQQSMKPHPNTRRATRSSNSYHPELDTIMSSESGNSSEGDGDTEESALKTNTLAIPRTDGENDQDDDDTRSRGSHGSRSRRETCDDEYSGYLLSVAAKEARRQRQLEQAMSAFPNGVRPQGVEHFFVRDNSEDDVLPQGDISEDRPPGAQRRKSTDPGWAVKEMRAHAEKVSHMRISKTSLDEEPEMAPPPDDPLWTTNARHDSHDSMMINTSGSAYSTSHAPRLWVQERRSTPSAGEPEAGPWSMPYTFRAEEPEDFELRRMRKAAAPPMLGGDLKFRMCPSPQATRMEPTQPYSQFQKLEETNRDVSGDTGLWRGYCSAKVNDTIGPSLHGPPLLHTPMEPSSPIDLFASAFSTSVGASGAQSPGSASPSKKRSSQHYSKGGIQLLSGLEERLNQEKARKEREDLILAEFDDAFTTQVYNYLSLGYPAMARAFDDELSKISGVPVTELRRDDHQKFGKGFMRDIEMSVSLDGTRDSGYGDDGDHTTTTTSRSPREDEKKSRAKPPRWTALHLYILEWARQHPDLGDNDLGHLAWGVRARRGSWAV